MEKKTLTKKGKKGPILPYWAHKVFNKEKRLKGAGFNKKKPAQ